MRQVGFNIVQQPPYFIVRGISFNLYLSQLILCYN